MVAELLASEEEIGEERKEDEPQELRLNEANLPGQDVDSKCIGLEHDRSAVRDETHNSAQEHHAAERRDERWNLQIDGDQAVGETDDYCGEHCDQYCDRQGPAGLIGHRHQVGGQHKHRANREIELAGDHQNADADRHGAKERNGPEHDCDIGGVEIAEAVRKNQPTRKAEQLDRHEHQDDVGGGMAPQHAHHPRCAMAFLGKADTAGGFGIHRRTSFIERKGRR